MVHLEYYKNKSPNNAVSLQIQKEVGIKEQKDCRNVSHFSTQNSVMFPRHGRATLTIIHGKKESKLALNTTIVNVHTPQRSAACGL